MKKEGDGRREGGNEREAKAVRGEREKESRELETHVDSVSSGHGWGRERCR